MSNAALKTTSSGLTIVPLGKTIGADVIGLDVSQVTDAEFKIVFDAWMKHQVLRFRGQKLTKEQLLAFSARFGELDRAPINAKGKDWIEGFPNMAVMSNIMVNGEPIGSLGYGEAVWHTDMSYNDTPPSAALLYGEEVTKSGGETGFINMYDAYDSLPETLKQKVETLTIKHDASRNSAGTLRKGFESVTDPRQAIGAVHPAVRRHPVTGRRALFLGRRPAGYIMGLPLEESEKLLDTLWSHVTQTQDSWFQTWSVGDLIIWDNRCVMHKRTAFDPAERRFLLRTQVKGTKPVA